MTDKRSLEAGDGDAPDQKKQRVEPPPPAAAPAVAKPAVSLEALEKAKKALQLQKELKEKLKNLPQVCF